MTILSISILTLIASAIGTVSGFGTSTIMMPILLFMMPVPEALLLSGIIHWFNNVWRLILFKKGFNLKILLGFGITGVIFSVLGASLTLNLPHELIVKVIAVFFIIYVIYLFVNPEFHFRYSNRVAMLGGASSGFMAGMFGVGGAFRAAVLSAFNLPKEVFLHTSASIALLVDSSRIITYLGSGVGLGRLLLLGLIAFIPVSYIGTKIGQIIVHQIPQKQFRYVICVFLFLVSIRLLLI